VSVMNAANQAAFIGAMQAICAEPTLGTVQSWLWSLPEGGDSSFLSRLCLLGLGLDRNSTVSAAKARLEMIVAREEARRALRDWKFDMNRLIAVKHFLRTIERFEQRNARAA